MRQELAAAGSSTLALWDALPPGPLARAMDIARANTGEVTTNQAINLDPEINGAIFQQFLQDLITYGPQLAALVQALIAIFCLLVAIALTPTRGGAAEPIVSPTAPGVHVDMAGHKHKVGGLRPLTAVQYHRLKAAAAHTAAKAIQPGAIAPIDLRDKCPPVLDQDGYNCCAGCSGTMGHRLAEILAGNPDPDDSVADLYDRCNGGVDEGADLADCVSAMVNNGVAPASLVPQWQIPIEDQVAGLSAARVANPLEQADFLPDQASMLAALEAGKPVYFGIIVTNRFNPDKNGRIGPYGGIAEGGHAVLALGVTSTANGYSYIVRNSWGDGWGASGNCFLDSSWAQPEVYGAFALSGRNRKAAKLSISAGTANVVQAVYYAPDPAHLPAVAYALAGSAATTLDLATWAMSDSGLSTALCSAAGRGVKVATAFDVSSNTNSISLAIAKAIHASGGTAYSCKFPPHIANNFLTADGAYTLTGNYYFSPTALQIGSYLLAVSGTPAAAAAQVTFASLIASGTPVTYLPEPDAGADLVECQCPYCPSGSCPQLPSPATMPAPPACGPADGKPREIIIDVPYVHIDWKTRRPAVRQYAFHRRRLFPRCR